MSQREVRLGQADQDLLLRALRRTYQDRPSAVSLLRRVGFPEDDIPPFRNVNDDWQDVFDRLASGVLEAGYRKLICESLTDFPWHPVVRPLAERLGIRCSITVTPADHSAEIRPSAQASDGPSRQGWADRVLVVGASPDGVSMIRADQEMREVRAVAQPQGVDVEALTAAAFLDLLEVVDHRPDVLHLICHSDGVNLEFAEPGGGVAEIVSAQRVIDVLTAFRDNYNVGLYAVVLNCCNGADFAQRFLAVADVVVAHRGPLDDVCARGFARQLYRQVRTGHDIGAAAMVAAALSATPPDCENLPGDLVVLRRPD